MDDHQTDETAATTQSPTIATNAAAIAFLLRDLRRDTKLTETTLVKCMEFALAMHFNSRPDNPLDMLAGLPTNELPDDFPVDERIGEAAQAPADKE